jgi:site-specific DNA-methyltransferase (adenine-specific)
MDLMARYPDKYFDLALVDPPYVSGGGKCGSHEQRNHKSTLPRFEGRFTKYQIKENFCRTGGTWASKYGSDINRWDIAPPPEYFAEVRRVSKYLIIFGGNYFTLPPSRNFIIWRKLSISENFSMAMAEYAWTDIPGNAKVFECVPQGKGRFHPTQKPVQLYKWILSRYAKPGWRILDTHLGSGTHVLACVDLGFDLTACEINEFYFTRCLDMILFHLLQGNLFFPSVTPAIIETRLFD